MNVFKGIRAILPTVLKEDASGHRHSPTLTHWTTRHA